MRIQFWHSPGMNEWRWSLYTRRYAPNGNYHQETGSSKEIREAFENVATTIEELVEKQDK